MSRPPHDEPTDAALEHAVRALRPGEQSGSSVLVVGATTALRADRVRTILDRLALDGAHAGVAPPLFVRVHAEVAARARDGRTLHDEVSSAVEEALDAEGVPGSLPEGPEEPGTPALAALGGWLFRARNAGRKGLVLVIDEADAWIDGRGLAPSGDARRSALAWLDELLDECARCSVSVLVSTRASDAAGSPAIPGPVVGRFAWALHLGGAPVATRDPRALVPRLEGRSFTLRALERALAGWLELAPNDRDTVVHFASPITSPPAVPEAEAATREALATHTADAPTRADRPHETLVLRDSDPDDIRAEDHNEDRISGMLPVQGAKKGAPEAGAPAVTSEPVTDKMGDAWREGVRAALGLRELLGAWRALPQPLRGVARLEKAYTEVVSKLPLAIEALAAGERATGIEATRARTEAERVVRAFDETFAEQYGAEWQRWLAGAKHPKLLSDLPGMLAHATVDRDALGSAFVVVTGLRFDAWPSLKAALASKLPSLTVLEQGAHWSARPATPATQRELIARGLSALANPLPARDEPATPRTLAEAAHPRREHLGRVELQRVDAYAVALTRGDKKRPSLRELLQTGERYAVEGIAEVCKALPENAMVMLAGDAGLAPGRGAPEGGGVTGYGFGADAPACVVVPYALLHWAGSAPSVGSGRRTRRKP